MTSVVVNDRRGCIRSWSNYERSLNEILFEHVISAIPAQRSCQLSYETTKEGKQVVDVMNDGGGCVRNWSNCEIKDWWVYTDFELVSSAIPVVLQRSTQMT